MGVSGGPDIIQDGLVLALDASDKLSYPGSGTTWTDISGNRNNGTLTNGPTFSSTNGGAIVFDGTDDYIQNSSFTLNPNTSGFTYESVITSTTINTSYPGYRMLVGMAGSGAFYGILVEADNRGYRLDVPNTSGNRIGVTSNINIPASTITYVVWSWLSGVFKLYLNGVLQINSNQGAYTAPNMTAIRFGYAYSGANYYWYGNHYLVRMYNKVLSDTEILQNYNAQKSRFGL